MAITFKFFSDAGLTTPLAAPLFVTQNSSSPTAVDSVIYFGSATAGRIAQAASDPGVDELTVSIVDANSGTGSPATDVKLALSSGGLAGATGGAALDIGTEIESGTAGAVEIHVRILDSTHAVALNTDLSLAVNSLAEYAV
jgi:hypothetical protein